MTLEELKKDDPELYEEVVKEGFSKGKSKGKNEEWARVMAWLDIHETDPKRAIDGIKEGKLEIY